MRQKKFTFYQTPFNVKNVFNLMVDGNTIMFYNNLPITQ